MTPVEWAQVLGSVGEFLGALVVVATLIYLARQVRQNTAGLRTSAYQTWVAATTSHFSAAQTNPDLAHALSIGWGHPGKLTKDNWVQFAYWCHQFILITEATYHLHQEGVISDSIHEKECQRAAALLATPGGAQWWVAGARTQYSEEFVAALEETKATGDSFQAYHFEPGRGFYPVDVASPLPTRAAGKNSPAEG